MYASEATRVPQPVGVLLGGTGRVRVRMLPPPVLAALLRPGGIARAPVRDRVADGVVAAA